MLNLLRGVASPSREQGTGLNVELLGAKRGREQGAIDAAGVAQATEDGTEHKALTDVTTEPTHGTIPVTTDSVDSASDLLSRMEAAAGETLKMRPAAAGAATAAHAASPYPKAIQEAYNTAYDEAYSKAKKAKLDHKKCLTRAQVAGQKARKAKLS